ncbi:sensor histidine kinase [Fundidesulfovibrio agrisoli]|uniref:sensor histidine kinase n=1 Tax=Fundidesulfovibrio agrisoli TaxID=2922717 RepID=UPI001FAD4FA9|nr:ATP-binding protein [Fundidesulfovibrio agrisoli]
MSSSLLATIRRSTGFRLTVRYAVVFILSSLVLFVLAYMLLANAVRTQDQKLITEKLNEYSYIERTKGLAALVELVRRDVEDYEEPDSFVRILDPSGAEMLTLAPQSWRGVPSRELVARLKEGGQWLLWKSDETGDAYEFGLRRLSSGAAIIVGGDARSREALLSEFQRIFLGITVTVVALGVAAGTVLSYRSLAPIRDLIATVKSIEQGSLGARVLTRGSGDELDELASLFNSMLGRISTLIQGMRDALDNVAHDLRTPLTRAKAVIETALQSDLDETGLREALMDCAEENERIRTTLNTLMDISEAETGTMRLDIQREDLALLIEESAEVYEYLAMEKGIALVTDAPPGLYALVDGGRVRQVLANLLDNALKYSKPGGKVQLRGWSEGGHVRVLVSDEGEGIPAKDMPRIFERLYRGDKSRTHRGLGLGLSLVRAVLKAHGGDVSVRSEVGKGSEFEFTLPGAV